MSSPGQAAGRGVLAPLVKLTAFVVVTVLATAVLALTIANTAVRDARTYRAVFSDVTALAEGDDVRMSGVRIGQVERLRLLAHDQVSVEFSVDGDRWLSASVSATIRYRNLVGQRYIALEQGEPGPVNAVLPPGGVIPLERTRPALDLTVLFNGFRPLFQALSPDDVNTLSHEIIQVLQGEGGTVDSLLAHTASLTTTLAGKDQVIGEVIDNLNTVLDTVNSRGDQLSTLVTTVQQLVSGLAADHEPIGNAISGLAALTDSTAGLLEQGRQPLKDDIAALGAVSRTLADNQPVLDEFLRRLPVKLDALGRVVSYGSWFNYFLCSASTDAPTPPGGPPVGIPVTETRCHG
ncbi:MCE family protein [Goodfellowiella coeruleoviolacea]|uniref:Phospholipid/cholesterol/gamma-HCH transport system substrate-binding protein n=1 Tax=Goodfellowiella coeruleoviolacea TaxID=334858 RepID=A0AAE3KII7_9PSEU|nr:MCE family protein [Goodfellowiella coeruleoviolacea]MCP2169311.1 phospholipid/cholesterol/gamma-HCH transport system substrate-binding protein [Goodfellowiella coeruleoviolacea]